MMLRRMKNKLRSCVGESIGETLVALLIAALALLMLAGAVSSASRIVTRNKVAMEEYYGTKQAEVKAVWDGNNDIVNLK